MAVYEFYADGACEPNPGIGGWGLVVYRDGTELGTACGGEPRTTNNRMEMLAITRALQAIYLKREVIRSPVNQCFILSDSQLCVNTLTQWARNWERRNWGGKKNIDLVKPAWELVKALPFVRIEWVKGHAGNRGNERADRLADIGRQKALKAMQ